MGAIKAGTIWKKGANSCKFLRDISAGDAVVASAVLINGERPKIGSAVPFWMLNKGGRVDVNPPEGVEVIEPEG